MPQVHEVPSDDDSHESELIRRKDENSRLLREEIAAKKETLRALPEVVSLYTSDVCNLKCRMCPRRLVKGEKSIEPEVLLSVCEALFPTARKVIMTGAAGEPLLEDFESILDLACKYWVRLDVITNGTLLTPELYRKARAVLDHINVSLDSHVPETYEQIRKGAKYDKVMGNLKAIREIRRNEGDDVLFSVSFLAMKSNLPHLPEFVRFAAKELAVEGILCQKLRHDVLATPEEDPEAHLGVEEIMRIIDEASEAGREEGMNLFLSELGLPNVMPNPLREKIPPPLEGQGLCWFAAQNFGLSSDGSVGPCCFPNDFCYGNVTRHSIEEIWNGENARALRKGQFAGQGESLCPGCMHNP